MTFNHLYRGFSASRGFMAKFFDPSLQPPGLGYWTTGNAVDNYIATYHLVLTFSANNDRLCHSYQTNHFRCPTTTSRWLASRHRPNRDFDGTNCYAQWHPILRTTWAGDFDKSSRKCKTQFWSECFDGFQPDWSTFWKARAWCGCWKISRWRWCFYHFVYAKYFYPSESRELLF